MEELLLKLKAFFAAADNLPSGSMKWEDDEKKVSAYVKAFNDLRDQFNKSK